MISYMYVSLLWPNLVWFRTHVAWFGFKYSSCSLFFFICFVQEFFSFCVFFNLFFGFGFAFVWFSGQTNIFGLVSGEPKIYGQPDQVNSVGPSKKNMGQRILYPVWFAIFVKSFFEIKSVFGKHPFDLFWVVLLQEKISFYQTKPKKIIINIFLLSYGQKNLKLFGFFFKKHLKYFCMF